MNKDNIKKLSDYKKCPYCDNFWVASKDEFCSNCGEILIPEYYIPNVAPRKGAWINKLSGFLGFASGIAMGIKAIYYEILYNFIIKILIRIGIKSPLYYEIIYKCIFGLLGAISVFLIGKIAFSDMDRIIHYVKRKRISKRKRIMRHKIEAIKKEREELSYLINEENIIKKQLKNLHNKEEPIKRYIKSINKNGTSEKFQKIVIIGEKASSIINSQCNIYKVKRWKIALIRWANKLRVLIDNWDNITTQKQYDKNLEDIKSICKKGNSMLRRWKKQKDLAIISKGKNYIKELEGALEDSQSLYDELLAKAMNFAVSKVSADISIPSSKITKRLIKQIDDINAFADIQDFLSEFNKLEENLQNEYNNLQIEKEIEEYYEE